MADMVRSGCTKSARSIPWPACLVQAMSTMDAAISRSSEPSRSKDRMSHSS